MVKNLKYVLFALLLVFVTAFGVVTAFALANATTRSSFTINYVGTRDVCVKVDGASYISDYGVPVERLNTVTFDGNTDEEEQTAVSNFTKDLTIRSKNQDTHYAYFEFTITNISDRTHGKIAIRPTITGENQNETWYANIKTRSKDEVNFTLFTDEYIILDKGESAKIQFICKSKIDEDFSLEGKIMMTMYSETEFDDLGIKD